MKYRSEDESEATTSEEEEEHELQGGALHEQDIIDRIAKLSHDIHVHHQKHGLKPSIVKGFKILGEGIVHSSNKQITGGKIGGKINRSKKFNNWFKDIGQKFLPLNKNLSPIKHQMTQSAVDQIAYQTMTPEQQMQSGVDMFGDVMGSLKGSKKPPKPADYPQGGYYPQQDYYHEMYKPIIAQPVTSSAYGGYYDNSPMDFNSQPSSYERSSQPKGFGLSNQRKDAKRQSDAIAPYTKDIDMSKNTGKVNTGYLGFGLKTPPDTGMSNFIHNEQAHTRKPLPMKGKGKVGKMLKETSANATADLINSGSARAVHEMDTRGKGLKKGSPEMKERMAKMRAMRKTKSNK
jgi:hypothetical protein